MRYGYLPFVKLNERLPGEVIKPAYDVDVVVIHWFLPQGVVLKVQYRQLVIDEQVFRQVLQLTVG